MTVAEIITGYINVCGRFGVLLEVSDGVLYVHTTEGRWGYITQGLHKAGHGEAMRNAYGLLQDICQRHGLKLDFKSPGEFIAYTPTQFGIVPLPPHKAPEPPRLPQRATADFHSVEYAL